MSTGFKYQGSDLDDILEPYSGLHPNPDFTEYTMNGTSLVGRYSGSDKDWEKMMTGGGYYYRGTPIPACLKGYYPTIGTIFYTVSGAAGAGTRNIYLSRNDAYLTLSGDVSASLSTRSFRNGKIPMAIGILFCGGGGGSTSSAYEAYHDWDIFHLFPYTDYFYGGGGGGGSCLCVLSFDGLIETPRLVLGGGGSGGNSGGTSSLYIGDLQTVRAGGGLSGSPSTGAYGGSGGQAGRVINNHSNVFFIQGAAGAQGVGNSNTNRNFPGCAFSAVIASTDSTRSFGTPAGTYDANKGYGGGSLNGSYVGEYSNGTNGGGGGSGHNGDTRYSGGGGMAYLFY